MSNLITWNPDDRNSVELFLDNYGVKVTQAGSYTRATKSKKSLEGGKWYWEISFTKNEGGGIYSNCYIGLSNSKPLAGDFNGNTNTRLYRNYTGDLVPKINNIEFSAIAFNTGDTIGVLLDLEDKNLYFSKNGIRLNNYFQQIDLLGTDLSPIIASSSVLWAETIANFGATPFKHFSQELKDEGYLPYDLDNAHEVNLPYEPDKFLFMKKGSLYKPTPKGMDLLKINLSLEDTLIQNGQATLDDFFNDNYIVDISLKEGREFKGIYLYDFDIPFEASILNTPREIIEITTNQGGNIDE